MFTDVITMFTMVTDVIWKSETSDDHREWILVEFSTDLLSWQFNLCRIPENTRRIANKN